MVTFVARLIALTCAIAVGVLCETLICESAQAQVGAFGGTSGDAASLELFNSSGVLIATISIALPSPLKAFQGSISNSDDAMPGSFGGPVGPNTAYAAGSFLGQTLVDYFGFNLSKVTATVSSAKLILYSGAITNDLTYTLFGATQLVSQFTSSADQNAALYTSLVKSVTMINTYGSYQLGKNTGGTGFVGDITFALNAAAVEDINAAIAARETFVVAGAVGAPVPEPSTWLMMLAGFAGLGVVARRRAVKRRAAATAG